MLARAAALATLALIALPVGAADARGPVKPLKASVPPLAADAIPAEVGQQGAARFRVNLAVPAGLDPARFDALAASTARRWGLRSVGATTDVPLAVDRRNTVGFSAGTGPDALGVQRDSVEVTRERATGRLVGRRIVDQDLALNPDVPWQQGPDHPSAEQYDLETVLIHELGHMAGNKGHAEGCTNTPMLASAAPGEWWRTPEDWSWASVCAAAAPTTAAARARALLAPRVAPIRHETRVIVRYR